MKTLGKILGLIALLVVIAFAGQIGKFVGKSSIDSYQQGEQEGVLEGALQKLAKELSSKAPMMVDSATQLDNVINIRDILRYNYTLVDYTFNDISADQLHGSLEETIKNKVCTGMKYLIKLGATIEFAYYGNKGKEITVISIPPSLCTNLQ